MAAAEFGSAEMRDAQACAAARPRRVDAPTVLDTTELRWCFPGPLPSDVRDWFARPTGVTEQRCDTYVLDGRCNIGVKRRFREMLELKVRQSLDGWIELGEGLAGSPEVWRKWSPAEGLVDGGSEGRWVDVHKSIVKRRFSVDGTEIAFSSNPLATEAGCDVEVVEVTVGMLEAWMLAFAAFGPPATQRDSLLAAWHGLVAASSCPEPFALRSGRAMSYPEWLAHTCAADPAARGRRPMSAVALR